jgi:hypothetical protein
MTGGPACQEGRAVGTEGDPSAERPDPARVGHRRDVWSGEQRKESTRGKHPPRWAGTVAGRGQFPLRHALSYTGRDKSPALVGLVDHFDSEFGVHLRLELGVGRRKHPDGVADAGDEGSHLVEGQLVRGVGRSSQLALRGELLASASPLA